MKKKVIATSIALLLSAAMLIGCGKASDNENRIGDSEHYSEDDADIDGKESGEKDKDDRDSKSSSESDKDIVSSKDDDTDSTAGDPDNSSKEGSTASAKAYANDIKEFMEFNDTELDDFDDDAPSEQMQASLQKVLDDLNVETPEGIAIKKDLQEMVTLVFQMYGILENLDFEDENSYAKVEAALTALSEKMDTISKQADEHLAAFTAAAEAAGVDEKTLSEFTTAFSLDDVY